jgi:hypothetical protein
MWKKARIYIVLRVQPSTGMYPSQIREKGTTVVRSNKSAQI